MLADAEDARTDGKQSERLCQRREPGGAAARQGGDQGRRCWRPASRCSPSSGYDAATTREVAQAAGVNEQLIQRYFGGKAGLLLAIIERFGEEERRCCALPPPMRRRRGRDPRLPRVPAASAPARSATSRRVALHRSLCDPEVAREIGRHFAETRVPLLRQRLAALREQRPDRPPMPTWRRPRPRWRRLSFGLAFVDQLIFGADCEQLRQVIGHVAQTYARGLAPASGGAQSR